MRIFPNPDNPQWVQPNTTDLFGNLYSTRNINLERQGYMSLSDRVTFRPNAISGNATAVAYDGQTYKLAVPGIGVVNADPVSLNTALDGNTNAGLTSANSDIIYWNNTVYYTNNTDLRKLTGGNYTSVLSLTTATYTTSSAVYQVSHPMCTFENKVKLAVGDGNIVRTIDESNVVGTTLTLPKQYIVDWIRYFGNKLYIGTRNITGDSGMVFTWDYSNTEAQFGYPYYSFYSPSGVFLKSTLYIYNVRGQLLMFTGGGFDEVARFPVYNFPAFNNINLMGNKKNTMCVVEDQILISFPNSLSDGSGSPQPFVDSNYAGIWSYEKNTGLTHKFSSSSTSDLGDILDYGKLYAASVNIFPLVEASIVTGSGMPLQERGSRILISDSSNSSDLGSVTTGEARGAFTTNKIVNSNVKNVNKKVYLKYRKLKGSTDKILVKYKYEDRDSLPSSNLGQGAWTTNNTFIIGTSQFANLANLVVGDEVEIMSGIGAGILAHITTISSAGVNYTITLDESVDSTAVSTTSAFKFDNFVKLMTIDNTTSLGDDAVEIPIEVTSKWIYLKCELRGEDVEIEQLLLIEEASTPSV